ncbi:MAG: hypothetical protein EKK48_31065 [Candidatus Melainabacteria bacterium]|nr:MAG: hypothetical protein EKK48_31065 [Candidatus Melainabacteria bacterium]
MIHFSVTSEQAREIMLALIDANAHRRLLQLHDQDAQEKLSLLMDRIALAVVEARLHATEPATPNIEEIATKEGLELCKRIS